VKESKAPHRWDRPRIIKYRGGYKYQLVKDYVISTKINPEQKIRTEFLSLWKSGRLTISVGYAWDGPTGAFPTKSIMRGSLVHDALYQLMRAELLLQSKRKEVDNLFRAICLEDGMLKARAWWVYRAVRQLAAGAADPRAKKKVLTAP